MIVPWQCTIVNEPAVIYGRNCNLFKVCLATIRLTNLNGMTIIGLATSIITNFYANIVHARVVVTVEYRIASCVSRGILNTCVAIVSKIPTYQYRLFITTVPKFREEIFSECIIGLRNGFKTYRTTIAFPHLYFVAVV